MHEIRHNDVLLQFGEAELEPAELEPHSALELAAAYFDLMHKVAEEEGFYLKLQGLEVVKKCAAIESRATNVELTKRVARRAGRYLGARNPPRGLVGAINRVRTALDSQPERQRAVKIWIGPKFTRPLEAKTVEPEALPEAKIALRAEVQRLGGAEPIARFHSRSEDKPFSLRVPRNLALKLRHFLWGQVDIVARVHRDEDGAIDEGVLVDFEAVSNDLATVAWEEWIREHGEGWDEVDDVLAELGRDSDD